MYRSSSFTNKSSSYVNKPHPETSTRFSLVPFTTNRNYKSLAWNYFHVYKANSSSCLPINCNPENGEYANCNICGKNINFRKKNDSGVVKTTTSGLINHLSIHKIVINSKSSNNKRQTIQDMFNSSKKPKYVNRKEKDDMVVQKTLEWICMDLQPISCVESPYFRNMMITSNPDYKPIGRKNIVKSLYQLEDSIRDHVLNLINTTNPWFSVTVDHWTSCSNQNYTGMTIHWIDQKCSMSNLQLGCWLHEGSSEAAKLVDDFVLKLFEKCHLTTAKISAVVTDTCPSMNSFGRMIETKNIPHIYCTDHTLQCTAKLAFDDSKYNTILDEIETDNDTTENFKLMRKCRSLVEVFTSSCQKEELLLKQQSLMAHYINKKPVKAIQDVVTRWWSTYSMLSRLVYLKPAINSLKADNQLKEEQCLKEDEWKIVELIIDILKPFKSAQKHLEGENYVTVSYIPLMIDAIEKKLKQYNEDNAINTNVRNLVSSMIDDFTSRWGHSSNPKFNKVVQRGSKNRQVGIHPLILIATALDPRLKNLTCCKDDRDKKEIWDDILEKMIPIMTEKANSVSFVPNENDQDNNSNQNIVSCDLDSDVEDFFNDIEQAQNLPNQNLANNNSNTIDTIRELCSRELKSYQDAKLLEIYSYSNVNGMKKVVNCPLKMFWELKKDLYPTLFELAKKYLCIPATSAPSERVFSVASKIISKFRNRLHHDTVGSILFVHGNLEWYKKQFE